MDQVVISEETAAVFRRAGELAIDASGIGSIRIFLQSLLKHDFMLPLISEIIDVGYLCACLLQHCG